MSSVYNLIVSQKTWNGDELAVHLFAYKELLNLAKELDMNQIDEVMDVTSSCLKKESELPSLNLLRVSAELLSLVEGKAEVFNGKKMVQKNWSVNFRIVIRRLLQTPAIAQPAPSTSKDTFFDQYLPVLFELSDELVSLIGSQWFESDPDFLLLLSSMSSIRLQEVFHEQTSIKEAFVHGRLHCHFAHCGEFANILPDDKATILCGTLRESAVYTCQYYYNCGETSNDFRKTIIPTFQFLCIYIDFGGLATLPPEYTKNLGEILLRLAVSCCEMSLVPLECLAKVICELPNLPNTTLDTIVESLKKCNNKANKEDIVRILDTLHVQLQGGAAGRKWCPAVSLFAPETFIVTYFIGLIGPVVVVVVVAPPTHGVMDDVSSLGPRITATSSEERSLEKALSDVDFKAYSLGRLTYFRVALVGEAGSEKNNVRRAYVQLISNRSNQFKAEKVLKESIFEHTDVLDSNVVTVRGFQLELMCAERIVDFKRIPTMIRCSHLDAIIIFYHISSLRQFESIHQKWVPIIRRLYRSTPFIICATGIEARLPRDVRQLLLRKQLGDVEVDTTTKLPYKPRSQFKKTGNKDPRTFQSLITTEIGQSLATELKASYYCEVSTKTYEGIEELFNDVLAAIISSQQSKICLTRNRVGRPRPKDACSIM
ncbi:unnamed protein product [Litomosoides sigmodontis]|uniref:Uncharacterized protein n=1 Tax=Litomosoides sigmodontis TaxID=42156 RepID=A0A3P6TI91_LITSI|nr:unnamed protein product [Litomosoides sigmodontis]